MSFEFKIFLLTLVESSEFYFKDLFKIFLWHIEYIWFLYVFKSLIQAFFSPFLKLTFCFQNFISRFFSFWES